MIGGRSMIRPIRIVILIDVPLRFLVLFLEHLHITDRKDAHGVRRKDILLNEPHINVAIRGLCNWPVPVALSPSALNQIRNHDNLVDILLPDHLPEAVKGIGQGSLGANERTRLIIAIDKVRINVRPADLWMIRTVDRYARMIVRYDVQVAILGLIFGMQAVLGRVAVVYVLILDELVLLAEADVAVCVQFGRVLGKVFLHDGRFEFTAHLLWNVPFNCSRHGRLICAVFQVEVGPSKTSSGSSIFAALSF